MSASRPSRSDGKEGRAGVSATRPFLLRAVLFDFDGTLTHPDALDFAAIKREVGCPPDQFVLEWILALPHGEARDAAASALERFELAAADASAPNEGAEELVHRLKENGLAVGVLTRNGLSAVERTLDRFPSLTAADFDVVVTRDDDVAPKPAPDGVLHAAALMGAAPEQTLVVGDFLLDMQAGRAAGAVTAYLANGGEAGGGTAGAVGAGGPDAADCDFVVGRLAELTDVVPLGLPLAPGKLPNDLLAGFLAGIAAEDAALLVPPRVGEDVAAVDLDGAELLVAHGDPITLGGDAVGRDAVLVNVNDIAASGADPRWLLATVLLPAGTTPSQALAVLGGLATAAEDAGVTLAGGHTEVTDAVTRPVVSLTALGTLRRAELKDKRSARAGDRVLLTKALAMEGAALLAGELGERLRALGMTQGELDTCRDAAGAGQHPPRGPAGPGRGRGARHARRDRGRPRHGPARTGDGHRTRGSRPSRPRPRLTRDGARLRVARRRPARPDRLRQPPHLLRPDGRGGAGRDARGGRHPGHGHRRAHGRRRRRRRAGARPAGALAVVRHG